MDAMILEPDASDPNPAAVHHKKLSSGRRLEKPNGENTGEKHEKHGKSLDKTRDMKLQVE